MIHRQGRRATIILASYGPPLDFHFANMTRIPTIAPSPLRSNHCSFTHPLTVSSSCTPPTLTDFGTPSLPHSLTLSLPLLHHSPPLPPPHPHPYPRETTHTASHTHSSFAALRFTAASLCLCSITCFCLVASPQFLLSSIWVTGSQSFRDSEDSCSSSGRTILGMRASWSRSRRMRQSWAWSQQSSHQSTASCL